MTKVSNKKIKVLMITPALNYGGGIEKFVINYTKYLSKDIIIDVATHENNSKDFRDLIKERGGKVFLFPKLSGKNIFGFCRQLNSFFSKNYDYDIIHCNMPNASPFYFYYAKKYNIKNLILHSHETDYADIFSHKLRNIPLIKFGKKMAKIYVACSEKAGNFMFKKQKYIVFNNAIEAEKYIYSKKIRKEYLKKLKINSNEKIIGHIGRLTPVKNQLFLLDIFKELKMMDSNYKLLLIGKGEMYKKIEKKIQDLNLNNSVIMIDSISNPEDYYQVMDVFVLPSIYEGLPFVAVEAQASGLHVVTSTNVSDEIPLKNNVTYLSLDFSAKEWAKKIKLIVENHGRGNTYNLIKKAGFDIKTEAYKLEELYVNVLKSTNSKKE